MRRRQLITLLCGVVVRWPSTARAQQRPHHLALVHSGIPADELTESAGPFWVRRVYETLRKLGDIEGNNLIIERFSAEGRSERFASLAVEVVARGPDVILLNFDDLVKAFLTATSTIPLVAITGDPIASGLLTNLAHPGGNLTGVSINAGVEIYGKRLQILKQTMPRIVKVAALLAGSWSNAEGMSAYSAAARQLGIELIAKQLPVVNDTQLRHTYAEMADQHFDAIVVDESGSFLAHRALLVELAEKHRIPAVYPYRDYVELGGMMAYAPDLGELAQRLANDVHQILSGAKAGDLPYYQPNTFELIVNAKSVKALLQEVPPALLARADEVIE
jgi:putative ABC transport system substrate-binding protein